MDSTDLDAIHEDPDDHDDDGATVAILGAPGTDTDGRSSALPWNPWAERAAAMRTTLPRGVQGTGAVKRSLRVDLHGGDFAAGATVGYDDPCNSAADTTDAPAGRIVGSTREWYSRSRPWRSTVQGTATLANGAKHREAQAITRARYDWDTADKSAPNVPADQDFGTFVRSNRGASREDGILDLDSLPPTTYVFGSRRRVPSTVPPTDGDLAEARAERNRAADALAAAARRAARDAGAECAAPGCPGHGPLRRGLCDACRVFTRRNGFVPPPEVIRRRRWRRDAPLTA